MNKINRILNYLGKIQYPWHNKTIYSTSTLKDINLQNNLYKMNSLGMQYRYFKNEGIIWNNPNVTAYGDSYIIRNYDAIYFNIHFQIKTTFNTTGNWNICKFTDEVIPQEYLFRDIDHASDVLATVGFCDSGGLIFGVRGQKSINQSDNTTYQLIGQGYVANTKYTTGLPVYTDYFVSGKFTPNFPYATQHVYNIPQEAIGIFNATKTVAYAVYDSNTTTLTFFRDYQDAYTNNQIIDTKMYFRDFENSTFLNIDTIPWIRFSSNITKVEFNNPIKPLSTAYWFYNCTNLATIKGIEALNMRRVSDSSHMFENCSSLTQADLSFFDTLNLKNINSMLKNCVSLETLYIQQELDLSKVTDSQNLFYNCNSLIGQNGTTYNSSFIDKTYARIDTEEIPGYLTYVGNKFEEEQIEPTGLEE